VSLLTRHRARHAGNQAPAADAVLCSVEFDGSTAPVVFLTGIPAYLGSEVIDGRMCGKLRLGTGPGAHVFINSASPEWGAGLKGAVSRMVDDLADDHMCPVPFPGVTS
jgi:hypothetical protein